MNTTKFDAIIIGFGKGGKTLAADLAGRGWSVAILERSDKMYGGTCINIGCIPTKTLVHDAKQAFRLTQASFEERNDFYVKAIERKKSVVEALRKKNYNLLFDKPNVTVFNGEGSFLSNDTVQVKRDDKTEFLTAPHIFINTGANSVIPPIEGAAGNPFVYTSTSLMETEVLPKRLVIVGGGYIGLEFASMYASFGSKVTVLEYGSSLIAREDRDIAEAVRKALEHKGVGFRLGVAVNSILNDGSKAVVHYSDAATGMESHDIDAEAVLLSTGRKAETASLNLDAAGVKTDARGNIIADEHLLTSNPSVYALGDVKGGLQFTYISLDDYRIVRDHLFSEKGRSTWDRTPVVYSMFIDPPMSRIGMSEDDAKSAGLDYSVRTLPVTSIPRAKTLGESEGLLKAIVEKKTGKILGCTLFCPESSEIINIVSLAMKAGLPAESLHNFIFTHPSMSEALNDLF